MAERRMFAKALIDSDLFLDLPLSAQALYFHLSLRADDDGFVGNPRKIQRMVGGSDDDMKLLVLKQFVLVFDSGVIVIRHWRLHNYIRSDRYKETIYTEEKAQVSVGKDNLYTVGIPSDNQAVDSLATQERVGKERVELGENRGESTPSPAPAPPPPWPAAPFLRGWRRPWRGRSRSRRRRQSAGPGGCAGHPPKSGPPGPPRRR